jgi:hypothetical protein
MAFRCSICQDEHDGLPDLGCAHPDPYLQLSEADRERLCDSTLDRCIITYDDGQTDYFIRGVVEIPIIGEDEPWGIGVWVTQSEENFDRYIDGEEEMGPTFGWLANRLGFYEESTFQLKTNVHFQDDGRRPLIELEPTDHPFAVAQREGITLEQAWKIVHRYMD